MLAVPIFRFMLARNRDSPVVEQTVSCEAAFGAFNLLPSYH